MKKKSYSQEEINKSTRIAIGAPHYMAALLCIFAGLYLLALSWALLRFDAFQKKDNLGEAAVMPQAM